MGKISFLNPDSKENWSTSLCCEGEWEGRKEGKGGRVERDGREGKEREEWEGRVGRGNRTGDLRYRSRNRIGRRRSRRRNGRPRRGNGGLVPGHRCRG